MSVSFRKIRDIGPGPDQSPPRTGKRFGSWLDPAPAARWREPGATRDQGQREPCARRGARGWGRRSPSRSATGRGWWVACCAGDGTAATTAHGAAPKKTSGDLPPTPSRGPWMVRTGRSGGEGIGMLCTPQTGKGAQLHRVRSRLQPATRLAGTPGSFDQRHRGPAHPDRC